MRTRLGRTETTAANRRAVLAAARALFEERGFHGAAIDAIAERAGFSEGVVYSQFGNKVELFLAVLEASIAARAEGLEDLARTLRERGGGAEDVNRLALDQSRASLPWQAALVEFRAQAWRDPELNARYRELHARAVENVASVVHEVAPNMALDASRVAVALLAATTGLTLEAMANPEFDLHGGFDDLVVVAVAHAKGKR
jgi:AcrR family transcriptional regulator